MKNDVNEQLAQQVENVNAAQVVLAQRKPQQLYQGYATKTSHLGVKVDFRTIDKPFQATDSFEAQLIAIEQLGGVEALKSDTVGKWSLNLTQVS